ncbi:hypothetical protein EGJ22_00845 [Pseudomonas sp. p99-361]|uniref:hypothetical protein n=1 Tax=Pseudomonas sp. p99-361 TaxID=2479852 RepID=UPI000F785DDA|nr:hypothetical protein [Pseudomonas sp. p99-361]RRV24616.1 hypothetical protein EGJ22_00845 [Pseudomonas sp. p99-361]
MKKEEPVFRVGSDGASGDASKIQMNFSGVSQNTDTHLINVTEDKLRLIIISHHQRILKSRDWVAPLGVFISLVAALLTADFKEFLKVDGVYWRYAFMCCAAVSFWLTLSSLWARFSSKVMTVKDVVDTVANRKPLDD